MKVIVVGDVHGRTCWEKIIPYVDEYDKIVFVGDYFDSFDIKKDEQVKNMRKILEFKKEHYDKVVLLFGNHDTHYLKLFIECGEHYSGFQSLHALEISEIVETQLMHVSDGICFETDGVIYSHAGITKTWLNFFKIDVTDRLVANINDLFFINQVLCVFMPGVNRSPYGDDITQSPVWVRPFSLAQDALDGFKQVVGHTHHREISINERFVFVDTQDSDEDSFLVVKDGVFEIVKIDNIC